MRAGREKEKQSHEKETNSVERKRERERVRRRRRRKREGREKTGGNTVEDTVCGTRYSVGAEKQSGIRSTRYGPATSADARGESTSIGIGSE